jgi:3-oxoacyl-ACP reductase-like protein
MIILKGVLPRRRPQPRQPSRIASATKLHTTTVRNEHAYYCCAVQCLAAAAAAAASSATVAAAAASAAGGGGSAKMTKKTKKMTIHVVGDSHVLSPAWATFKLSSTQEKKKEEEETDEVTMMTLKPELTTGCKHWHLRPDCSVYP